MKPSTTDNRARLQRAMAAIDRANARIAQLEQDRHEPIAVVGMACRFPGGGDDPSSLWQALESGVDGVREAPTQRWGQVPPRDPPGIRWAATLDEIDGFDAEFFGISPREATRIDPQQRLLLEVSWEALEAAGLCPQRLSGTQTGVFIGITTLDYQQRVLDQGLDLYSVTGTAPCFAAGRLSYALGLQGPSVSLDTACSSSLVAIHQACHSLREGESEVALVGGVNLICAPSTTQMLAPALSPSGRCMSFDSRANGYVRGEGCGVVVLKRLEAAERAGDRILAIVRGSAVNHDGRSTGLTAPNVLSQQRLLRRALADARVSPEQIGYVETHGTGTPLGDPIEIDALRAVVGSPRTSGRSCVLGAIKTNLGHLEAAAGIAGFIKTVLVLEREAIPKNLHFEALNPMISLEGTCFEIPTSTRPWPRQPGPRFAGVSSFGMSGTNAHVVLEEAPRTSEPRPSTSPERAEHLLVLSARTEHALRALAIRYADHLERTDDSLAEICHAAATGRTHFEHRLALVAPHTEHASRALRSWVTGDAGAGRVVQARASRRPKVAFLFTGQGSQYPGMGVELLEAEPVYRDAMQRCAEILDPLLPDPLVQVLRRPERSSQLHRTQFTQPILVALEWSLAQLWKSWGVEPDVVMGHSVGEYTAAIVAGALDLESGLGLIASRGRRMQQLGPGGVMLSVSATASTVERAIERARDPNGDDLACIAAYNGPRHVVVSGSAAAVARTREILERAEVRCRALEVSHAFHSHLIEPMLPGLAQDLGRVSWAEPSVPLVSNVTGRVVRDEIGSTDYWLDHTRKPVAFEQGMQTLHAMGCDHYVELGPQPVLLGLGRQCLPGSAEAAWLPSLRRHGDAAPHRVLLSSLGALHASGLPVDLEALDRNHRRRVVLPAYPWQRRRYWIDWTAGDPPPQPSSSSTALGAFRLPLTEQSADRPDSVLRSSTPLDLERHPYLGDHRIFDRVVVPGAFFVTALLAALAHARDGVAGASLVVEDLLLPRALVLDEPTSLHLELTPTTDGMFDARCSSPPTADTADAPNTHAIARLAVAVAGGEARVESSLPQLRDRLPVASSPAQAAYAALEGSGIAFGPTFRTLVEIARAPGEALARIHVPMASDDLGVAPLHPCLLDACFQVFGAALPASRDAAVLPFGFEGLRLHGQPGETMWCHARLASDPQPDPQPDPTMWTGDITLFDASGEVVATIEGYRARAVVEAQLSTAEDRAPGPLYTLAWRPVEPPRVAKRQGRRWLVLADRGGLGQRLVAQLEAEGDTCLGVLAASQFERLDDRWLAVDPSARSDLDRVLHDAGELDGVVYLWTLDDGIELHHGCDGALAMVQALAERSEHRPPRLWLVTRGAQRTGSEVPACAQAALWGLGRVIAAEHPELASTLVDLDPEDDDAVRCLRMELTGSEPLDQVAWRGERRMVPRLIDSDAPASREPSIHPEAAYLITGGWGALGQHVATWLAERGARHLILAGRRSPAEARQALGPMEALLSAHGVHLRLLEADVSRIEDVERLVAACTNGPVPLRGVIHAAGVLDDGLLRDLSPDRLHAVLGPKSAGAFHLGAAIAERGVPLDFFVLFSSAAALIGPPGQGSYAAANAYLDALAHDLRARGCPALSIGWGPWQGAGMAARQALHRGFATRGVQPIEPAHAMELLSRLIAAGEPYTLVLPGTWTRTASSASLESLLSEVRRVPSPADPIPRAGHEGVAASRSTATDRAELLARTRQAAAHVLGLSSSADLDDDRPLAELGLDSLMAVELRDALAGIVGQPLPATLVFDHPSIARLSRYLAQRLEPSTPEPASLPPRAEPRERDDAIAVVGMDCRFPGGVEGLEAYWELLCQGVDAIGEIPADRWDLDSLYDPDPEAAGKMYTRWGGFLDHVDRFDARFFGITPREAASMDPQQRLLLEVSWNALEHAGIAAESLSGSSAGVFVGIMFNDYAQRITCEPDQIDAWFGTGNASSVASGRVSYQLGLTGPSVTIDTACSSSLVTVHLACQSLREGETDLALAGGATVMLSPAGNIYFSRARALAADGRCKSFSAAADGVVWSEGCGIVVLKRLADAQRDGDRILAVIRGSAVNQDGRSNGLSAPNGPSQVAVIERALRQASLPPDAIDYVEAHGTGTPLGDPVEARALDEALGAGRPADRPLWVSAVKSNIGHTQAAAGVAGLIKAVLALEHEAIPPTLHSQPPSPEIDWARIQLVSQLRPWPTGERPRRAGVSSFGISGTNAHLVLEEAPRAPEAESPVEMEMEVEVEVEPERSEHLLVLSARTEEALRALATRYATHLEQTEDELPDVCHGAATGRSHFEHRLAMVAERGSEAAGALRSWVAGEAPRGVVSRRASSRPKVAFLFTGQGSQHPGMGMALYEAEPVFRRAMQRCAEVLDARLPRSLVELLGDGESSTVLHQTRFTQPVMVALEWSLAQLWRSWGVEPHVVMGHSVGEYAAAIVSGALDLEAGLELVARRGHRMQQLDSEVEGVMLSVLAAASTVEHALDEHGGRQGLACIAAYNGPRHVVVSGAASAVARVQQALERDQVRCRRLEVSHAFHSPLIEPMLGGLAEDLQAVSWREPCIPLVSNLTGELVRDELCSTDYWLEHTRKPVAFVQGMQTLHGLGCEAYVELGPQPVLLGLGRRCLPDPAHSAWIPSLRRHGGEGRDGPHRGLLFGLGQLYARGVSVDFGALDQHRHRRSVTLPAYPWQRERHWIDDSARTTTAVPASGGLRIPPAGGHPLLGERLVLAHEPDTGLWQAQLDLRRLPYLRDHCIEGQVVMPGTAYLEMVLAASSELLGPGPRHLVAVHNHHSMVFVDDRPRVAQLSIRPVADHELEFRISSRWVDEPTRWQLHCSGRLHTQPRSSGVEVEPLDSIRARCHLELDAHEFYARLGQRGNHWGPAFQGIRRLWRGEGEVLAEIVAPQGVERERLAYELHPALSDACGHAFAACGHAFDEGGDLPGGAFVGSGAREAKIHGRPRGSTLWSHVRLREVDRNAPSGADQAEPGNVLVADIRVFDGSGALVAELLGARFWYLDASVSRRPRLAAAPWLYEVAWEPRACPEDPDPRPSSCWLVLMDEGGVGDALAARLEARGDRCIRIYSSSEGFSLMSRYHVRLRPGVAEDFEALLAHVGSSGLPPCRGLVHLWGLDSPPTPELSAADTLDVADLTAALHGLRVLASAPRESGEAPRLWLVTRGAQVIADDDPIAVAQAPLWGLGGVISREHPECWGGLVDLDPRRLDERPDPDGVEITALARELASGPTRERVALRGDTRWVARLSRWPVPTTSPPALTWRPDASYLVTGGLGGLGMAVARWMVEQGARHLVLAARTPLPPRAQWSQITASPSLPAGVSERARAAIEQIGQLEARGALVRCVAVDVADESSVRHLLQTHEREAWPPIRGVIHAAGVVSPRPLLELGSEELMAVLRPKTAGSWLLHQQLAAAPLDFMVLFSSASAMLPSPLLGAYPAANAFLDALAHHRRTQGLPAVSIAWGPWAEVGMAASRSGSGASGAEMIPVSRGLELLGQLVRHQPSHVGVLPMHWSTWKSAHREDASDPFYARVLADEAADDHAVTERDQPVDPGAWPSLLDRPSSERPALALEFLRAQVARIGRLDPAAVDTDAPLVELGLDSLMAVELRQAAERGLGVALPLVHFLSADSLDQLAAQLCEQLPANTKPTVGVDPAPAAEHWEEGEL
ncbi:MAG: SDR family NAD(P)-dependent oxidoreductase [Myxococcota bacterium]